MGEVGKTAQTGEPGTGTSPRKLRRAWDGVEVQEATNHGSIKESINKKGIIRIKKSQDS